MYFQESHTLTLYYYDNLSSVYSWYHGTISRQTSYERLQSVGVPGAYLVRDSTNQPGDYAISYLSRLGQIHHFKINSICGDYYIGGRQFSSLVDLIGYYTNCSHILENEGLEVPVMPPAVSDGSKFNERNSYVCMGSLGS